MTELPEKDTSVREQLCIASLKSAIAPRSWTDLLTYSVTDDIMLKSPPTNHGLVAALAMDTWSDHSAQRSARVHLAYTKVAIPTLDQESDAIITWSNCAELRKTVK